jgi:hypothetical protein
VFQLRRRSLRWHPLDVTMRTAPVRRCTHALIVLSEPAPASDDMLQLAATAAAPSVATARNFGEIEPAARRTAIETFLLCGARETDRRARCRRDSHPTS